MVNNTLQELSSSLESKLTKKNGQIMWAGIILAILGIVCLVFPQVSSLSTELVVGWILFFAGLVAFFSSFSYEGTGPFFGALLTSLLMIGLGLFFVFYPGIGMVTLTLMVGILFLVQASFQIVTAFELKGKIPGWGWLLVAALLSGVLAYVILANLMEASFYTLGILVGVNLLITGVSLFMISRDLKKGAGTLAAKLQGAVGGGANS